MWPIARTGGDLLSGRASTKEGALTTEERTEKLTVKISGRVERPGSPIAREKSIERRARRSCVLR